MPSEGGSVVAGGVLVLANNVNSGTTILPGDNANEIKLVEVGQYRVDINLSNFSLIDFENPASMQYYLNGVAIPNTRVGTVSKWIGQSAVITTTEANSALTVRFNVGSIPVPLLTVGYYHVLVTQV
jgi:hypothetical protein